MGSGHRSTLVLRAIALMVVAAASSAATRAVAADTAADQHANALVLARDGAAAYKGGQYVDALARFEKAFGMVPSPALALNLSHTEIKLGDCDSALTYADRYAATFTPDSAAGMETPEHWRTALAAKCPEVEITSDPPGATLAVRGAVTAAHVLPWKGHLPVGHLQLTATLAGHEDAHADLDVSEGVSAKATLRLATLDAVLTAPLNLPAEPQPTAEVTVPPPVAPTQVAQTVPSPAPSVLLPATPTLQTAPQVPQAALAERIPVGRENPHSILRTVGWSALAAGVAALVVGTGLGIACAGQQASVHAKALSGTQGGIILSRANSEGEAANVLFGVGGAVAAVGVTIVVVYR